MAKAHIPHANEMVEVMRRIKVQTRALSSDTAGRKELMGMVCELETEMHACLTGIEEFKQNFMDDYATTIFETHRQYQGPQNPFLTEG